MQWVYNNNSNTNNKQYKIIILRTSELLQSQNASSHENEDGNHK